MTRFSLDREEDSDGPSSPRRRRNKKPRTSPRLTSERFRSLLQQETQHLAETEEPNPQSQNKVRGRGEVDDDDDDEQEDDDEEEAEEVQREHHQRREREKGKHKDGELVGPSGDGPFSLVLTDSDVLDCPICLEPLSIPTYQCENGHIACSCCCIKVGNKCPSCSLPIGYNRCRAIEKVLESVKISCQNKNYGCRETVSYSSKQAHEKICVYSPCSCLVSDCGFVGSSKLLFRHFSIKHPNSAVPFVYSRLFLVAMETDQKHIILQEQNENKLFVLNRGIELLGDMVNVTCIGPSSSTKGFSYNLVARKEERSIRFISFTKSVFTWVEHVPENDYLVVPTGFGVSRGRLMLEVCISKPQ